MNWIYQALNDCPEDFKEAIGGHPLVVQELWRRGIRNVRLARQFLDPDQYSPSSPFDFPQMELAVNLILSTITNQGQILVWGDFDVDGQTATAILVSALRKLGAKIHYHIPIRGPETHGIGLVVLKEYLAEKVSLLITCDTGITAHEAIEFAKSKGVQVIITDHHQPGASLPAADVIINPVLLPVHHPAASLPGVGAAYKLIEAIDAKMPGVLDLAAYLDLVALGIVADVALLKVDTRYLLQKGLKILKRSERTGLLAIAKHAELDLNNVSSELIAFQIAPRLNAIGRLSDANIIVQLFLSDDQTQAEIIATQIESTNIQRRMLEKQISESANAMLLDTPELRYESSIIIHNPNWPAGVLGIVAGQLARKYNKPTLLLTGAESVYRGSARSIEGIDINAAIASQKTLLNGFGGHPMAAGLSLPADNLQAFRDGINQFINMQYAALDLTPSLEISWEFSLSELSMPLIKDFERLAPFGNGNHAPVFVTHDVSIQSVSKVGQEGDHLQITLVDEQGNTQKAMWWNGAGEELPDDKFDLAYHLSTNNYKGQEEISLTWVDAQLMHPVEPKSTALQLVDHRFSVFPLRDLEEIFQQYPQAQIWSESIPPKGYPTVDRHTLVKTDQVVLWEVPSSNQLLQQIVKKTKPSTLFVFSQSTQPSDLAELIIEASVEC